MPAPLVPVTIAFLLGILLGEHRLVPDTWLLVMGAAASMVALLSCRHRRISGSAIALLWVTLGALRLAAWSAHPDHGLRTRLTDEPGPVRVHAIVDSDPVGVFDPAEPHRAAAVLRLLHADAGAGWQPLSGRVRASFRGLTPAGSDPAPLAYGDELLAEGEWFRVPPPGNAGEYDWRSALERARIHGLLRVRPFDGLAILGRGRGSPVLGAVFSLRERWERILDRAFSSRDAGLLRSLLLGERGPLDEHLRQAFIDTGTVHLLVVSGFNVGLMALVLEWCFRLFGLPWRIRLAASAAGLGVFCILTGLQPPVARATLMAWVVLGALALDRSISWPNALAAAALVILWVNPTQLFEPSFQLSFGAMLSLLIAAPPIYVWLESVLSGSRHLPGFAGSERPLRGAPTAIGPVVGWLRRYASASLAATIAIWVGLSPVLAWYFHLVSPVSMLANLVLAPLVSILVMAGTAALLAATVMADVMRWMSPPLAWLVDLTLRSVTALQSIPGGHWAVAAPSGGALAGYYVLAGVSAARRRLHWSRGRVVTAWALSLTVWLWSVVAAQHARARWLLVDVLDVGHGDSILVRLPSGGTVLVDAGTDEAARFNILPALRAAGVTSLDALVLTHPDEDHIGGAPALLEHLAVRRLLTNGVQDDTMSARRVRRLAETRRIPETVLTAGMRVQIGRVASFDVLHPPAGLVEGADPPSNDNSLVLGVRKGSVGMLLTGDLEEAGVPVLLDGAGEVQAAVFKVPHHGSRLGRAGEDLLDAVRPRLAVLSVGRLHHLPAAETLAALARHEVPVLSTRDAGTVQIRTDGTRLDVRTFKGGEAWEAVP
jgi:competence protein ComEC